MSAIVERIKATFEGLWPVMDSRTLRLCAASEAKLIGTDGIAIVCEAPGMSAAAIRAGLEELEEISAKPPESRNRRGRQSASGRMSRSQRDTELIPALETRTESVTSGDPTGPLRWTFQSTEKLAGELRADGHEVSGRSVSRLLHQLGYIVSTDREMPQERSHVDPDAQFLHVCRLAEEFQAAGQPVVSVEAERKEIVDAHRNEGRERRARELSGDLGAQDVPANDFHRDISDLVSNAE